MVLAMLAAALLLVVPVMARAGGEVPHAHALIQLLADGADGAVDHHHHHLPAESSGTAAGARAPAAALDHASATGAAHPKRGGAPTPISGSARLGQRLGGPDHQTTAEADTPALSPFASAAVAALMAALSVALSPVPSPTGRGRRLFSTSRSLSGRFPTPESPPPRRSLLAV